MTLWRALRIAALASCLPMFAGCGDDAGSEEPADDKSGDDTKDGEEDDTKAERADSSVGRPDSSTRKDAGGASDTGTPVDNVRADAGRASDAKVEDLDASTDKRDASVDSGKKDAATEAKDAGSSAPGQCNSATPHGCYVPQPGNHPMCPAQSPEQSASYPPMNEWKGCNGIMTSAPFTLDPAAKCAYKGPAGELATCLCDTDLHWICGCGESAYGDWPACKAP